MFPTEGHFNRLNLCCQPVHCTNLLPYIGALLFYSHLHPYRVMAEEAANLPSGQDPTRVRVLVARHHLYPQRLQLGRIESPGREGGRECRSGSGTTTIFLLTILCHCATESVSENSLTTKLKVKPSKLQQVKHFTRQTKAGSRIKTFSKVD